MVSDIFGRSPFYEDLAARLAEQGYTALLLDHFFRLERLTSQPGQAHSYLGTNA